MTRDEIIKMAREAGLITKVYQEKAGDFGNLQRFAALAAAAEREACAKLCESQLETGAHIRCAAAIRKRANAMYPAKPAI